MEIRPARISPTGFHTLGYGLHFPQIDADVYLPALFDGILGFKP
jgi:hypothetical protein